MAFLVLCGLRKVLMVLCKCTVAIYFPNEDIQYTLQWELFDFNQWVSNFAWNVTVFDVLFNTPLLTVTWGMCSFVMTCFITSIGHGEPAMTPYNKELQKNHFDYLGKTCWTGSSQSQQECWFFNQSGAVKTVQNTTVLWRDANFPHLPSAWRARSNFWFSQFWLVCFSFWGFLKVTEPINDSITTNNVI